MSRYGTINVQLVLLKNNEYVTACKVALGKKRGRRGRMKIVECSLSPIIQFSLLPPSLIPGDGFLPGILRIRHDLIRYSLDEEEGEEKEA